MPLVAPAPDGYLGDDVWVYDGQVYRVAARPIVDRGQYVGAVVHGQKLDATLAQRLSERLGGATVGFFFRENMIASYTPADIPGAPTQAELLPQLPQVLKDPRLLKGERTDAFDVGGRARAVYSLVAGSASAAQVGYAVARPYPTLPTPWAIFDQATKEDIDALPKVGLALGLVLLFALAMGILFLEHDKPLKAFEKQVERLAQGQVEELDLAALNNKYRKIGEGVHKGIEVLLEKGGGKSRQQKANLDEILGPSPENLTSSAFSFGADDAPKKPAGQPMPLPSPHAGGPVALPAPHAAGQPVRLPPPGPRPAAPLPPPPARGGPALRTSENSVVLPLEGNDDATVVAEVSEQLRDALREDEEHYREVFDQYVELRRQCGESTSELAFEKFIVTLRKNRDQILMSRPEIKHVRFTVYVKAGKAALKATPSKG
jgi:hypothetical protein